MYTKNVVINVENKVNRPDDSSKTQDYVSIV